MCTASQINIADYDRMVERGVSVRSELRIELIRGEIREMNPTGPIHDEVIEYLTHWLFRATDEPIVHIRIQSGLRLPNSQGRPEPDVMWVKAAPCRPKPSGRRRRLADHRSFRQPLGIGFEEKAFLDAEAGIVEYWIDVRSQCIHVQREPHAGEFRNRSFARIGETLNASTPCQVPLDLKELFE